jgi:hypothetical protein
VINTWIGFHAIELKNNHIYSNQVPIIEQGRLFVQVENRLTSVRLRRITLSLI